MNFLPQPSMMMEAASPPRMRLKKTILLYGLFFLIVVFEISMIFVTGDRSNNLVQMILAMNIILLLGLYLADSFGMFCLVLAIYPFAKSLPKFELGVITFNVFTTGILILLLFSLIKVLFKKAEFQFKSTDLFIVLLGAAFLVSTLLADDMVESGYIAFHFIFIPIATYFVIKTSISSAEEYDQVIVVLFAGLTFLGMASIISYAMTNQRAEPFGIYAISSASLLIIPISYIIYKKMYKKMFMLPIMMVVTLGFLLTFSRALTLILIVSPIIFFIIKKGKAFYLFVIFFVLSFLFTMFLTFNADIFRPKVTARFHHQKQEILKTEKRIFDKTHLLLSIYGRALSYRDGLKNFSTTPIWGTGLFKQEWIFTYHNFHIEWLAYSGVLGYLFYLMIFLSHAYRSVGSGNSDTIVHINLLVILSILFNSLFNGIMHGAMPQIIFMMIALNEVRLKIINS